MERLSRSSYPAEYTRTYPNLASFVSKQDDSVCSSKTVRSEERLAMPITSSEAISSVEQAPSTFNQSARFFYLYREEDVMRAKFQRLVLQWREQRRFTSSLEKMILCPAHLRILAMGKPAVELIMDRLRTETADHWFRTLELLTEVQPVRHEDRGDYEKMRRAWLGWWDWQT